MGLAASQARLLLLTARKSDLELRAQQITNTEMILAMQTETIAKEYSRKLSNKKMVFQTQFDINGNAKNSVEDVSVALLSQNDYVLTDSRGNIISTAEINSGTSEWSYLRDNLSLQNAIKRGIVRIYNESDYYQADGVTRNMEAEQINIAGSTEFYETYRTDDDAEATAVYETKMAEIQVKEKQLQIDLQQVEVQQKACETEMDSVKKILDKNIDRTFKVFS